ncbi:MAG: major capsid protein, partial [Tepidiformaceae bacterium]
MIKLIGGDELQRRGLTAAQMRPVLGLNADPFAENATLRKDEWEQIDARVNEVMRQRLTVVADLRGRGLVQRVSLGTVLRRTERLSDFDDAEVSFDGDTAPQRDRPDFLQDVIPVPVIAKDFEVNWRQLAASRERGEA